MQQALRAAIVWAMLIGAVSVAAVPEVRRVVVSSSPGPDLTYATGDRISVTVQFDQEVDVTGTPVLRVGIGSKTRNARMWMHSGSRLHFGYTVGATDSDPDGIAVAPDALVLGEARISAGDERATVSLAGHAIANAAGHKVDGPGNRRPKVTGVSITSDPGFDGAYAIGDEIEVTVQFDEGVTVEGSPSVAVTVGDAGRQAIYRRGSGTSRLAFAYEVVAGDVAEDGIALPKDGLRGGGGVAV